jgi:predicted nucleic-acid-binding Zn-ribbon protein
MPSKPITKEIFIERAISKYGNKYNYSNMKYVKFQLHVEIICPEHGSFYQKPHEHLRSKHGCPKCGDSQINKTRTLNTEEFIKRSHNAHNNKYDYSLVKYIDNKTKVKIICPIHGEFEQEPNNHMRGMGCNKCGQTSLAEKVAVTIENFIERSNIIHDNKYDYSLINNITPMISTKVPIICPSHGIFKQIPHNHVIGGYGCPKCSHNGTSKDELIIENYLIKNDIKYIKNDTSILGKLELDFYLPKFKIGIELNGIYWHSELKGKDKYHHLKKLNLCKEKGIRLIQYTDYIIKNKYNIFVSNMNSILNISKRKIHGRKCEVKEINNSIKSKFLNKYHLQGNDKSSIKLGLFYNNHLVSVMTFCKRRVALGKKKTQEGEYELSRYCGNFNFYVIGGASKLLKYFERNYNPTKIVTYADKNRSCGDLYIKLGFEHTHDSSPNYWYFKSHYLKDKIYHRFNFRKSQLSKKLKIFDPQKTEWENMKENNWNRYWDCGNMVFETHYQS